MAFYLNLNESTAFDTLPTVDCDKLINMDEVNACFEESSMEAAARICYENTVNWNAIQQATTIDELIHLESTGVEMLYEGAKIDAFIEKAKAFFKSIWNKIQEMFKKAAMQFNSWFQKDKDFIKKYKTTIQANINKKDYGDKEVEVYKYVFYSPSDIIDAFKQLSELSKMDPAEDFVVKDSDTPDAARKKIADVYSKEAIAKSMNMLRGALCDKSEEVEAGEFAKEVRFLFQGKDDTKSTVKLADMASVSMNFLENSENVKKAINEGLKQSKDAINNAINSCEKIKKELNKAIKGEVSDAAQIAGIKHTEATKMIEMLKGSRNIIVQYCGIALDCLKACSKQSKSICVKLVGTKDQSTNESYVSQTSTGSVLESVQLI